MSVANRGGEGSFERLIAAARKHIASAQHLLLILDFDGTIAEIVARPHQARLLDPARGPLEALARSDRCTVSVCTGRAISDVAQRVPIGNVVYAGCHGLEIEGPGISFVDPIAAALEGTLSKLTAELEKSLEPLDGVEVEAKRFSTSIHYRRASAESAEAAVRLVEATVLPHPEFTLGEGKMIAEIKPKTAWNKGKAAVWIRDRIAKPSLASIVVGDDVTDEDMFVSLSEGITVKVGEGGPKTTRARFTLGEPKDVARFLDWLRGEADGRVPA